MTSREFPGGLVVKDLVLSLAVAWVTAVAQVLPLAWELVHTAGTAEKKKERCLMETAYPHSLPGSMVTIQSCDNENTVLVFEEFTEILIL